jgi:tripartite-type tricarboxylate transporter receptor subunit TctC
MRREFGSRLRLPHVTAATNFRRRTILLAALGALPVTRSWARQSFPERPVRIVVPYSVGVGPDVVARSLAERLSRDWGQPVVVDNKPGASGIVAFAEVRRVTPDGHTLFVADTATLAVNPLLNHALPYDPVRDIVPLSMLFRATFVILVGGQNRFHSIRELLDAARRAPDGVSYASLGNGHATHVAIESMARAAGVRMLHVPFKDAGALFTAVAAGDVDFTTFGMNTVSGLVASGKLRPLAVAARKRLADYPTMPTLSEAGGPNVEMRPWAAMVAVAGTPALVIEQLQVDIVAALTSDEVRARIEGAGFEMTPSTPQGLRERVDADIALYLPLVREGRVAAL